MHVPNSSVMATRVTPRGVRHAEIELYVSDLDEGRRVFEEVARIVPVGPTHFVRQPVVREVEPLAESLGRVTGHAVVPPGREWLAEDFLPSLIRERAAPELVLHGPVVTPVDELAARRFAQLERVPGAHRPRRERAWRRPIRR
jgi:hypothetical protein